MQLELKAHPARRRHHVHPRHARPGGGDDDGRPDRGHERRAGSSSSARRTSLYERPQTAFVAGFLGISNLLRGTVAGAGRVRLDDGRRGARAARRAARPHRQRRSRRPPGEDPPRRTARRTASTGRLLEEPPTSASRRSTSSRPRAGNDQRLRPEQPTRAASADAGRRLTLSWSPDSTFVVDPTEESRMTDQLDQAQLLARGAARGAALTIPGLLAACGGSGSKAAAARPASSQQLAKTLDFSNWTLYIDYEREDDSVPVARRSSRRSTACTVDYVEDINDNASFFGKIQGPLSQRPVDRPRHHRPDRQRRATSR